ncbi:hypothetical protein CL654_02960, partial [bacterium]|nr:hypothetical protein [bacterium]
MFFMAEDLVTTLTTLGRDPASVLHLPPAAHFRLSNPLLGTGINNDRLKPVIIDTCVSILPSSHLFP